MKKLVFLVLFAVIGMALATAPQNGQAWAINESGSDSVSLSETIRVTIPTRYALHLTETLWELDLSNPPAGSDYAFSSSEPTAPENGCYLVPKYVASGNDLQGYLYDGGILRGMDNYPAIKDYNGDGEISNDEKGTLICVHHKILQKFSNDPDGWKLLISVTNGQNSPTSGFGYFGMADHVLPAGAWGYFYTNSLPVTEQQVASGAGTTGGWLDDDIVEAFWFDGTEAAGDYELTVTFTLAGL